MKLKTIQNELFFPEVAERLAEGNRVRIRAAGNSMLPFIRDGKDSVILKKPDEDSFQKGSLLLVQTGRGNYILHRLMKCSGEEITLRGDGNLVLTEICMRSDVIAEAVVVEREGKTIEKNSRRWKMFRRLWPGNPFLRRVLLAAYRRISFIRQVI